MASVHLFELAITASATVQVFFLLMKDHSSFQEGEGFLKRLPLKCFCFSSETRCSYDSLIISGNCCFVRDVSLLLLEMCPFGFNYLEYCQLNMFFFHVGRLVDQVLSTNIFWKPSVWRRTNYPHHVNLPLVIVLVQS